MDRHPSQNGGPAASSPQSPESSANPSSTSLASPDRPTSPPKIFDADQCRLFLQTVMQPALEAGLGCMEMRIFQASLGFDGFIRPYERGRMTLSGWFDSPQGLLVDAARVRGTSAYVTVNPVSNELLGLANNRIIKAKTSTADNDIARIVNLFIDVDPHRKTGLSATDAELALALGRRDAILGDFPEIDAASVVGCSGNGGFILARLIGYPNDAESRAMIARVTDAIVTRYKDAAVKLDETVKNPARVMPLPGTMKCKGDPLPHRPHRMVTCQVPGGNGSSAVSGTAAGLVPLDLEALAARLPSGKPASVLLPGMSGTADSTGMPAPGPQRGQGGPERVRGESDRDFAVRRCRAMLWSPRFADAIEGQNGHAGLFHAAVAIWDGFGLGDDIGLAIFREWNQQKARPPEDEAQVVHKWEDAKKRHPVPSLRELNAPAPGQSPASQRNGRHKGNAIVAPAAGSGADVGPEDAEKPEIYIDVDEEWITDQAVAALSSRPDLYHRGNVLVRVLHDMKPSKHVDRPENTPFIDLVPPPRLREMIASSATWLGKDYKGKWRPAHPPDFTISQAFVRGEWPGLRYLQALVETPILRPDGSVVTTPGWDAESALLLEPRVDFPEIPWDINQDDASGAASQLLEVVSQFPFSKESHKVAWLAALLTPMARFLIDGACPIFPITSNVPGSGKSLLCDIISVICCGRVMPRTVYPDNDENEMRKRITSIALSGDKLMMIDNVSGMFGGPSIDALMTATTWQDRILGHSKLTPNLPLFTVWFVTGNNIVLKGDALRRSLSCHLESHEEHPEDRTGFKNPNIVKHCLNNRGILVGHCLTILSAYLRAGSPDRLPPWGSYEAWGDIVRSAVAWATGIDPLETRKDLVASDTESNVRAALVEGWAQLDPSGRGYTAAEAMAEVQLAASTNSAGTQFPVLYAALMELGYNGNLPSPKSLGRYLNQVKDRVINGRCLTGRPSREGIVIWKVKVIEKDGGYDSSAASQDEVLPTPF